MPKFSTNTQQVTAEDRAGLVQMWAAEPRLGQGIPWAQCRLLSATFKIAIRTHISYIINRSYCMCVR